MRRCLLPAVLVAVLAACSRPAPQAPPLGGRKLLSGSQSATATVVGHIRDSQRIDHDGYRATLRVERILAGALPAERQVVIGWEELSPSRSVRFRDGDRVIVALAPLPSASLWRTRFAGVANAARDVFVVAQDSDAYLVHPDPDSIATLAAYLSLSQEARDGDSGAAALAAMIARAATELAVGAATQLGQRNTAAPLPAAAEKDLAQALRTRAAPQLQALIIEIAARYRAAGLRAELLRLGGSDSPLAFNALMAAAAIDGSMSDDKAQALLSDPDPVKRMVAVRLGRGAILERVLPLLRSDPSPKVRAAAVQALIDQRGAAAMADVLRALSDPDVFVRAEAARALGQLGAVAVPPLLDLAKTGTPESAQAAVLALESTGAAGIDALHEVAANHPDASIRRLAQLALGTLEEPH